MTDSSTSEFIARKDRNLAFFKDHHPDLYKFFVDYQMSHLKLNILTESGEVDLIGEGEGFYNNAGHAFAEREVESFKSIFSPGKPIQTVAPISSDGFIHPRFMHRRLKEIVSPYSDYLDFDNYVIEFYPLLVFLGVGLGEQIEIMSRSERIQHMIVTEADPDQFAASLYVVEWSEIAYPFINGDGGRSIRFIIGLKGDIKDLYADIWNSLIEMCPIYPAGTMFYIHRGNAEYSALADELNQSMMWYLSSWGNYDDEIRQLNNALHTLHMAVPTLPQKIELPPHTPVFIVGNGPSLDEYIDSIRRLRKKVLLVSCGTALRSLVKYGVEPDFHVELESDYFSYRVLSELDSDILKRLNFISPSHICPLAHRLFKNSRIYFKSENCVSDFFGNGYVVLERGVPTCVNAAFVVMLHLGFKNIYFFGTDFGYRNKLNHHAKTSIYQDKDKGALAGEITFNPEGGIEVKDWDDRWIHTTPTFYSTMRMIERVIQEQSNNGNAVDIFGCTSGAKIEGVRHLTVSELKSKFEKKSDVDLSSILDQIFHSSCVIYNIEHIKCALEKAENNLLLACQQIKDIVIGSNLDSFWAVSICCSKVNSFLETNLKVESNSIYYLIRGSIWCWIYVGLTYRWMIGPGDVAEAFLKDWKADFVSALEALPKHFHQVTTKEFHVEHDPWVRQSINDPETGKM